MQLTQQFVRKPRAAERQEEGGQAGAAGPSLHLARPKPAMAATKTPATKALVLFVRKPTTTGGMLAASDSEGGLDSEPEGSDSVGEGSWSSEVGQPQQGRQRTAVPPGAAAAAGQQRGEEFLNAVLMKLLEAEDPSDSEGKVEGSSDFTGEGEHGTAAAGGAAGNSGSGDEVSNGEYKAQQAVAGSRARPVAKREQQQGWTRPAKGLPSALGHAARGAQGQRNRDGAAALDGWESDEDPSETGNSRAPQDDDSSSVSDWDASGESAKCSSEDSVDEYEPTPQKKGRQGKPKPAGKPSTAAKSAAKKAPAAGHRGTAGVGAPAQGRARAAAAGGAERAAAVGAAPSRAALIALDSNITQAAAVAGRKRMATEHASEGPAGKGLGMEGRLGEGLVTVEEEQAQEEMQQVGEGQAVREAVGAKPKAAKAKRAKATHLRTLPVMIPAALVKQREQGRLLCEVPGPLSLDGDMGCIGRVAAGEGAGGEVAGSFKLDLKVVVDGLFDAVLRCQPGDDYFEGASAGAGWLDTHSSDTGYGSGSGDKTEKGTGKVGKASAKKHRATKAGQHKPKRAGGKDLRKPRAKGLQPKKAAGKK